MMAGDKVILTVLKKQANIVVTDAPKFDLETYISHYSGPTKLARLHFIGGHSTVLCIDALTAAVIEAKNGKNVEKYRAIQQLLALVAPGEPEALDDKSWVDHTTSWNRAETIKLENELKQYRNNLVKESIRLGHQDLGRHLLAIGDLPKAHDAFSRMRQDCVLPEQIIEVTKNLISISMERNDWATVQSHVQKINSITQTAEAEKEIQPYKQCVDGLAKLGQNKYYEAANAFLAVEPNMGRSNSAVMSPNDVAAYGAVCALATMDRNELQRRVLDNSDFRTYLELEPQLRRAVQYFVNSRYSSCLDILESYLNDYYLDIYLSRHIMDLLLLIRTKSIVEYFIPFSCVTLDALNAQFAPRGKTIDMELINMIKGGLLEARIDMENRLLVAVPKNPRAELQSRTLTMTEAYEREMRRRIMRMNAIGAGLEVTAPKRNPGPGIL